MESPGEYLKREREIRGVTLAQVFEATRVPLKNLKALEADDFESMPHPTFVKGYIKAYCKVLGLDETDAVLRYEIYLREKTEKTDVVKAVSRPVQPKSVERPPLLGDFWKNRRNVVMAAGGAAAIIVIVIIILAVFLSGPSPEPAPSVEPVAGQAPVTERPEATLAVEEVKTPEKAAGPVVEPEPVKKAASAPEAPAVKEAPAVVKEAAVPRHSLVARATGSTWIQVSIDGSRPFEVFMKEGETAAWKAADGIILKIGNAGGVNLAFDGKELGPLGETGYVVRVTLPDGKVKVLSRPKPGPEKEKGPTKAAPSGAGEAAP